MAATVVVSVVSAVLDSLGALHAIHPYLLTHHWLDFAELLRLQPDWATLGYPPIDYQDIIYYAAP